MLHEVKIEMYQLGCNFTFTRNLSIAMIAAAIGLCGLAELQSQSDRSIEQNSIINMSSSSSTKIIVNRK